MQLQRFSLYFALVFSGNLVAQDILSDEQKLSIQYSKDKIEYDNSKLTKDWINPVTYTYSKTNGDTSSSKKESKSVLNIAQPIFKSGGIYNAIKYANSLETSSSFSLTIEEKESIKVATQTLLNIYKNELLIKKQNLVISNSIIDIKNKRESVLNGVLDISFLNNAILDGNRQKENLVELEYQKDSLINSFDNLTAKSYKEFKLPVLNLINDEKEYLKDNLYIKQSKSNTQVKKHLKGVVTAKYLPTVNANYTNTNNHTTEVESETYGVSVVVPLNINFYSDISSSKADFLKSKNQEKIVNRKEKNLLKTQISKIDMIDKKIELTKINIHSYKELLVQMKELERAGMKTKDDVKILENSMNSEMLDIKIFEYDKQIELLELYARVTSAI